MRRWVGARVGGWVHGCMGGVAPSHRMTLSCCAIVMITEEIEGEVDHLLILRHGLLVFSEHHDVAIKAFSCGLEGVVVPILPFGAHTIAVHLVVQLG